jgi:hypothetical protein
MKFGACCYASIKRHPFIDDVPLAANNSHLTPSIPNAYASEVEVIVNFYVRNPSELCIAHHGRTSLSRNNPSALLAYRGCNDRHRRGNLRIRSRVGKPGGYSISVSPQSHKTAATHAAMYLIDLKLPHDLKMESR